MFRHFTGKRSRKSPAVLILAALAAFTSLSAAQANPEFERKELQAPDFSKKPVLAKKIKKQEARPDILLVMPNMKADSDESFEALKAAHGTILKTYGSGELTTLVIQTEKGKLEETERKLSGDKHFSTVCRDYYLDEDTVVNAVVPNDPNLGWQLAALGVTPDAWRQANGSGVTIAIADSGCQSSNPDLSGHIYRGYDLIRDTDQGYMDYQTNGSHGTLVATTAAATTNNGVLTAAPAGRAMIFPIRISSAGADGGFRASASTMDQAIQLAGNNGIRIINISYGGGDATYMLSNARTYATLHQRLRWFHDQRNGLAFFSAGNDALRDPNPRQPYMIMVSAIGPDYRLARESYWGSNYGSPIWFTAPGVSVACSDRTGRFATVPGTSFASPLAASVAAMVMSKNSRLSNVAIERILINSCGTRPWDQYYGYGLPNAARALQLTPN